MSLQLSFRADLFRAVLRFAGAEAGVRVEPARGPHGEGAVLTTWSDDAALAVFDRTAIAMAPAQIIVPRAFVDALGHAVRGSEPGKLRVIVQKDCLSCEGIAMVLPGARSEPPASPWRREMAKHGIRKLDAGALLFRRDVMDDIGEAARMLARASAFSQHESERAEYVIKGGVESAVVATFPAFPDAFALIGAARPPAEEAWHWAPPWWLHEQQRVGAVA